MKLMKEKGSATIFLLIGVLVVSGLILSGAYIFRKNVPTLNNNKPVPTACTNDSQCRNGSKCQALESQSTVCPQGITDTATNTLATPKGSCQPTTKIIKGECKGLAGKSCQTDVDCYSGLTCYKNVCANPVSEVSCSGPDDNSCPAGYRCVERCGPPVVREGDQPPGFICQIEELAKKPRNCPICLASNTRISTPLGEVSVKDVTAGMKVYSVDKKGQKIISEVIKVSSSEVSSAHQVVHLVLTDGRELWVSPDHPAANGFKVGQLMQGEPYDGSVIQKATLVSYWDNKTYDLLPDSETGYYFANGILMGSTLKE